MKLEKYRKLNYTEQLLHINHPFVQYKKINFKGIDSSDIELDIVTPNTNIKGVIIDIPEFKVKNKLEVKLEIVKIIFLALIFHF